MSESARRLPAGRKGGDSSTLGRTVGIEGVDSTLDAAASTSSFSESESKISITSDIALGGRDPWLYTGGLASEEGADGEISDGAWETGPARLSMKAWDAMGLIHTSGVSKVKKDSDMPSGLWWMHPQESKWRQNSKIHRAEHRADNPRKSSTTVR
ncbi:hypothetical protein B0H10DRAFT_1946974 [Mycena sp. CBHHK59/15]|nr:hypothetical protein B0H10DRAFT_1946974 [Mycena sp. CBHHK59/15]